jgi:hypothetical protein
MRIPKRMKSVIYRAHQELEILSKRNKQSLMSHFDFQMWARFSAENFQSLFARYIAVEFEQSLRPVVERIDWGKGFETENLVWVENQERRELIGRDIILTNDKGKEYHFSSATVAEQENRFPQGVLCRALRTGKSHKGWKVRRGRNI